MRWPLIFLPSISLPSISRMRTKVRSTKEPFNPWWWNSLFISGLRGGLIWGSLCFLMEDLSEGVKVARESALVGKYDESVGFYTRALQTITECVRQIQEPDKKLKWREVGYFVKSLFFCISDARNKLEWCLEKRAMWRRQAALGVISRSLRLDTYAPPRERRSIVLNQHVYGNFVLIWRDSHGL